MDPHGRPHGHLPDPVTMPGGGVDIDAKGIKELSRSLRKTGHDLEDLKDANEKVSKIVVERAKQIVPTRSGALAKSIRSSRKARQVTVRAGVAKVPYAAVIHWGWPARGIPRRPYVTDAAHQTESRWESEYKRAIQRELRKIKGA